MATTKYRYEPDLVLPPGESLADVLKDKDMTQAELSKRTGMSTKHINQIVNGAAPITPESALLLERATGVNARFWSNLEVAYREFLTLAEEEGRLEADLGWLQELPLTEMVKHGCIRKLDRPIDTLRDVCKFFGVANHAAWQNVWHKPTAYRTSKAFKSDPGAVAAWLRLGELQAAALECQTFDRAALVASLEELRSLSAETDPHRWWPALRERCSSAGVAVVGHREVKGARINGAARWLAPDKAVVQLSLRYKSNDIFWFTFFHEIGHLLIHSKKDAFINDVGAHSGVELEADGFSAQVLIPRRDEAQLAEINTVHEAKEFAKQLGIAPGIVVGRLQHDGRWPFSKGNDLKQQFQFTNE